MRYIQLLLQGCPILPSLPRMAMSTITTMHNPSRFAELADDVYHAYILIHLENDKPRPKSTRNANKQHSAYVNTSWWWNMRDVWMYIFSCSTVDVWLTDFFPGIDLPSTESDSQEKINALKNLVPKKMVLGLQKLANLGYFFTGSETSGRQTPCHLLSVFIWLFLPFEVRWEKHMPRGSEGLLHRLFVFDVKNLPCGISSVPRIYLAIFVY